MDTKILQKVTGKVRSAQRAKFRRMMGSTYNRQQKKWKDTPVVKVLLNAVDHDTSFSPAEQSLQKYPVGSKVKYKTYSTYVYEGEIVSATKIYSNQSQKDEIQYKITIVGNNHHYYYVMQDNIVGYA